MDGWMSLVICCHVQIRIQQSEKNLKSKLQSKYRNVQDNISFIILSLLEKDMEKPDV